MTKKKDIEQILSYYSIGKNDFEPTNAEGLYRHKKIRDKILSIAGQTDDLITVHFLDADGVIKFVDTWKRKDGVLGWKGAEPRESISQEDSILFREMQNEYYKMKYTVNELEKKCKYLEKRKVSVNETLRNENTGLKSEIVELKKQLNENNNVSMNDTSMQKEIESLKKEIEKLKSNRSGKHLNLDSEREKELIDDIKNGMSEKKVIEKYNIGRATFYRIKKNLTKVQK